MNFKVGDIVSFYSQTGTQQTHEIEEIVQCKQDNGKEEVTREEYLKEETLCKFYNSQAYFKASSLYLKKREIVITVLDDTGMFYRDDALLALRKPLGEKLCNALVEPDLPLSNYMGEYSIRTRVSVNSFTCNETGKVGWKALIVYIVDR